MFDGFSTERFSLEEGIEIHLRIGGSGPPLLLLQGNLQTHVIWHKVAPSLAERYTVVAADLRDYGNSSKPDGGANHENYSFRAMGRDQEAVMEAIGPKRFMAAGHDRGARVSHVSGQALDCGHYLAEEAPKETLAEIFEILTIH